MRCAGVFLALALAAAAVADAAGWSRYDTGAGPVEGKLNVHLVAHSHDDVGWLKNVDQYFVGSNRSIQAACVRNVLDSVVEALRKDPNRKFIFAEQAFFQRWWSERNQVTHDLVRKLVHSGQLEFVNGGWCMHDEAATHYIDMIDQTTLGHLLIKRQFNKVPRVGWQIDPFGHSAVQAYLLGAELGFDSLHFARIDYQDRKKRKIDKSLEVIWRGSRTFGPSSQIFTNAFPVHYGPPEGFHFEVNDNDLLMQDDPLLFDYNVEQRVNDFILAAITQANVTRTNHIMWTMGDDFQYQYAETWFRQMDRFIHYINKDGRINAFYSTPSIYTDAKNSADESWPLKSNDYFPYADNANAYWTGYFTSRPALKKYVRMLSGYYLAARQLEFLSGRRHHGPSTSKLADALAIAQHHDAISGTAKQHTTDDYIKRLSIGSTEAEKVVSFGISCLVTSDAKGDCDSSLMRFSQCPLLNISYCPPTEKTIPRGKSLVVVAYNPLGWERIEVIRIPVLDEKLIVKDSDGNEINIQYMPIDNLTIELSNFYKKAYHGIKTKKDPKYWLLFEASIPPLGWNTFFISQGVRKGWKRSKDYGFHASGNDVVIGQGPLKMSFSSSSGVMKRVVNQRTGVAMSLQQGYLWYESSMGDEDAQASGAYIFRPTGAPVLHSNPVLLNIVRGPLVDEVHQQFNSWIHQVVRLFKNKEHAEIEFTIGPIPTDDNVGKEVITRINTSMITNKTFYTDSNGRDFLKRIRDFREDWDLHVNQRVAGNYYPLNLGIVLADERSELSILVDRATGGASIRDGEVELMLHRRILADDGKGVEEPLNEIVCIEESCHGLVIRGYYHMSFHKAGDGARWRRTNGQQIYSPIVLAFTHENEKLWRSSYISKSTSMHPDYSLPPNVAIITLQELDDGFVLLRLAHLYEKHEDPELSTIAIVELKKIFAKKKIKEAKEMSLSANQERSKMKRMKWKVEGESDEDPGYDAIRGSPLNQHDLIVELAPMEIRTFLLKFHGHRDSE